MGKMQKGVDTGGTLLIFLKTGRYLDIIDVISIEKCNNKVGE